MKSSQSDNNRENEKNQSEYRARSYLERLIGDDSAIDTLLSANVECCDLSPCGQFVYWSANTEASPDYRVQITYAVPREISDSDDLPENFDWDSFSKTFDIWEC